MQTQDPPRYAFLDAIRGLAMVWMTVFHFCYDLQYFGWLHTSFHGSAWWTLQRAAIVSLFVLCAGAGQALAHAQALGWRRFWARWWRIVAGAALVTLGSWLMFPASFIYFGILHGLALMTLLGRCTAGWRSGVWLLGAAALALAWQSAAVIARWPVLDVMNTPWLNWLGFISHKPFTEDYAPLLPWMGVLWLGMGLAQWALRTRGAQIAALERTLAGAPRPLAGLMLLGRHSLAYYLLHQPCMIAALWLVARLSAHTGG